MRQAWRFAGMKAELQHLIAAGFSGEALYWFERSDGQDELRRRITEILTPENSNPNGAGRPGLPLARVLERAEQWNARPEGRLTVSFCAGAVRKVEL